MGGLPIIFTFILEFFPNQLLLLVTLAVNVQSAISMCAYSLGSSDMDSRIVQLAKQILEKTTEVDNYLQSHNLPQPSFKIEAPLDFSIDSTAVEGARRSAIEASTELQDLLIGPTMILRPVVNLIIDRLSHIFEVSDQHDC